MSKKLHLVIELEYDDETIHGMDSEAIAWFWEQVLHSNKEELFLHSNVLGDVVGTVKVIGEIYDL